MRRLLRGEDGPEADVRPTLLGIVTLLFLLLFFLLSTSTGQRLGVVDVQASSVALATLPHTGLVQDLRLRLDGAIVHVEVELQTTDIAASASTTERRRISIPPAQDRVDLLALGRALEELHALDPARQEALLLPAPDTTVETLLSVMDTARGTGGAPLFPKLVLGGEL